MLAALKIDLVETFFREHNCAKGSAEVGFEGLIGLGTLTVDLERDTKLHEWTLLLM